MHENLAPWVATFGLVEPYGRCQCGCGGDAPIATLTDRRRGTVKGQPARYIRNHHWPRRESPAHALLENIHVGEPDECWPAKNTVKDGYGQVRLGAKMVRAHRLAWTMFNGPIPDGLNVLHACDNPACCNPAHLWLGTQRDNVQDMLRKKRGRWRRHQQKSVCTEFLP